MINHRISADWSTTSRLQHSLVHHVYKKYIPKLRSYTLPLVSQAQGYYSIVTHRKCIAKHMINPRISADWSTTSRLQHSLVHHVYKKYIPKLRWCTLPLVSQAQGYYSFVTHRKCIAKHMIKHRISGDWSTTSRLQHSLVHHVYKKYVPKLRWCTIPLVFQAQGYYSIVTHRKCIAKHMINPRISADWSTTKPIAAFSCTPCVQ